MAHHKALAFQLEIDGLIVEVNKKPVKNLTLRINAEGQVKISAPLHLSQATIQTFVIQKQHWITTQLARLQTRPIHPPQTLHHDEIITLFDKPYRLQFDEHPRPHYKHHHDSICCYLPDVNNAVVKQRLLQQCYLAHLQPALARLLQQWQPIIGVQISHCSIRKMKSRWGSCQPESQRITINLQLVHYPLRCLEYVVVHELVHLLEASHNQHFYALMTQFMPDWQQHKACLFNYIHNTPPHQYKKTSL